MQCEKNIISIGCKYWTGGVQYFLLNWIKAAKLADESFLFTWYVPGSVLDDNYLQEFKSEGVRVIISNILEEADYLIKLKNDIKNELKNNYYDIIHVNTGNILLQYVVLNEARKAHIQIRIAHSHNFGTINSFVKEIMMRYFRRKIRLMSSKCVSCSDMAGKWLFGEKVLNLKKYYLVKNRINVDNYILDNSIRMHYRKKLGLTNHAFLIGSIGSLSKQKIIYFLCR